MRENRVYFAFLQPAVVPENQWSSHLTLSEVQTVHDQENVSTSTINREILRTTVLQQIQRRGTYRRLVDGTDRDEVLLTRLMAIEEDLHLLYRFIIQNHSPNP